MRGFRVLEAADGTEALRVVRERKEAIDLVLLDVTIPGAPSREVLAEIRRVAPKAKVIVTSAYGQSMVDATFPGMETGLLSSQAVPARRPRERVAKPCLRRDQRRRSDFQSAVAREPMSDGTTVRH